MTRLKKAQVLSGPMAWGRAGNLQTVSIIKKVSRLRSSDPHIRALALKLIEPVSSQNHLDEAARLAIFVRDTIRYVKDPEGVEMLQDPLYILRDIGEGVAQGDCDDQTLFLATLLKSVGISPKARLVRYKRKDGHYDHIYLVVYERNWGKPLTRLALDPILKRNSVGVEVPHLSGDEFDL